tara:strand:- start:298 stop:612 length:315 start_codon:yes stop_codon:yes gene_type:complete
MLNCLQLFLALSLHLGLENDYNNIHPHARCTVDNHISGIYYNSENNISLYTGFEHNGFELGLVTGYSSNDILPMIRYKKNNWFISPAYETDGNYGITIGLEIGR